MSRLFQKLKSAVLVSLVSMFSIGSILGQTRAAGTVVDDATGETLPFVTIMLKGTTTGVTSDIDGRFSIDLPSVESVLVFSYMGYDALELPAGENMMVKMKTSSKALEGVVITGYQTIARERVTGSVSLVNSDALEKRFSQSLMGNLEGRVAGLVKTQDANGNDQLTIRGVGTLNANRTPLLVVDGMPIEGSINDLNPFDIESVTVLKDAAAAAIYGARASNGIIVVTTKKARQEGTKIDVSANFTMYQKRNVDYADNFLLTPEQQINILNDYYKAYYVEGFSGSDPITNRRAFERDFLASDRNRAYDAIQYANYLLGEKQMNQRQVNAVLNELKRNNYAQEYADNMLLNRFVQQYNVALRGKSGNFQQNLVLNLRADNGGIIEHKDNRFTISYRGEYKMADWVTADFGLNMFIIRSNTFSEATLSTANNPFAEFAFSKLLNDDGSYVDHSRVVHDQSQLNPAFRSVNYNAMEDLAYDRTLIDRNNSRYNAGLTFTIMDGLTAQTQLVYENNNYKREDYAQEESYLMRTMRNEFTTQDGNTIKYLIPENGGRLWSRNIKDDNWTARAQVNYNKVFQRKHAVDFLAGTEFRETLSKGTEGLLLGYDDQLQISNPILNYLELQEWATQNNLFYYNNAVTRAGFINNMGLYREIWRRYASGYANLTYTYDEKYNVFGSFRRDYANVYGLDSKYRGKPLWSLGLSWVASGEEFMKTYKWINYLKVRGSVGVTGNIAQDINSVMTGTSLPNIASPDIGNGQAQMEVRRPANPYLTWEKTMTINIGADFTMFKNRLRGGLDYYYKKSDDVFSDKLLDPSLGFSAMMMNNASLFNQGVEALLTYDWYVPKGRDQFSWTSGLTMAYNYNKITQVDMTANSAGELVGSRFRVGYATSAVWAYQFAGMDDLGRQTFLDQNGAKILGNEIVGRPVGALIYAGQLEPKISIGMDNTFRYKGFSLNILTMYQGGNVMRVLQAGAYPITTAANPRAMPSYLLRAWTATNTNTDVSAHYNNAPVGSSGDNINATNNVNTYVQPADYLKIRNIALAYDIPQDVINKFGMSSATVRFQLDNPPALWLKNKVGVDPETLGIRRLTSFIFGLNVNF